MRKSVFLFFFFSVIFVIFQSCHEYASASANEESEPALLETMPVLEAGRRLILTRGNHWIYGIPGFGANNFPALMGEYRISSAENTGVFWVYLTREVLFFSQDWQPAGANNQRFERSGEDGFFAAFRVDARGVYWFVVFRFPPGFETAFSAGDFALLYQAWTDSLLDFLPPAGRIADTSLPAVVEF